ncbi:NUDIX hydrolase [Arthrobacter sp. Bz4]|uniref:NUDIX hydrolase n=1 Tax=Arthrobacter sp. Bz4 TaxID=2171979 RepID=UPI000D51BF4F|nr:NUDIX hydrolase [Arthrobacter sp. Bz4]PVE18925.1 NUDIX hydrolase [Arthrobacter sp. Bz4]
MASTDEAVTDTAQEAAPAVVAAGAICWRKEQGKLEVLLIHRPSYTDWSWPKGKIDPGETTPECAAREVLEEVGLRISLGIPLASTRYAVASGQKVVYYWAARTERMVVRPDGKEVDKYLWVAPARALELLTNPTDREPLESLIAAYKADQLETWPLIVVRHAKAKPRSSWTRAEGERPLAATGRRQAAAVSRLLEAWGPSWVVSSPWERCVQTVAPYLKHKDIKLKLADSMTERNATRKPDKARSTVEKLFDKRRPVALCTHRPVLPLVFGVLQRHMPDTLAVGLPADDPYLAPGEVLISHVSTRAPGRIVALEQFRAYDD